MDTVADFTKWIKTKPRNEEYHYLDTTNCCFAQFLKDTGVCADPAVGGHDWNPSGHSDKPTLIPEQIIEALRYGAIHGTTFGNVLKGLSV